jgi:hypothetical protein
MFQNQDFYFEVWDQRFNQLHYLTRDIELGSGSDRIMKKI